MNYIESLEKTHFFTGLRRAEIENLVKCLRAEYCEYEKDESVLREGDLYSKVGIVLSGQARSVATDISGKSAIVTLLKEGGYIGVLLAASAGRRSPVSVYASSRLSVLSFPTEHIFNICAKTCQSHITLLRNFLDATAEKALALHDRVDCLLKPTIREKTLAYLVRISAEKESGMFNIPLDRNAMAEYLGVDRSALSRELGKMKKDGLIDFYKNSFKLLV